MAENSPENVWQPAYVLGENRKSRWLILCDHASNVVPPSVADGHLGIAQEDMDRHIAYDVGAAGVATRLADLLEAPAILANFSRLVIDPNRGEDDPTLVMQLYDGTIIPANRGVDGGEVERRLDLCYRPYNRAIADYLTTDTIVVSVHSFTPQFKGRAPRPWHVGLLSAADRRLTEPLLRLLSEEGELVVGDNVPYTGFLAGDTIDRHAIALGLQNTLIEIRNDLIAEDAGQAAWAERLARLLPRALAEAEGDM